MHCETCVLECMEFLCAAKTKTLNVTLGVSNGNEKRKRPERRYFPAKAIISVVNEILDLKRRGRSELIIFLSERSSHLIEGDINSFPHLIFQDLLFDKNKKASITSYS